MVTLTAPHIPSICRLADRWSTTGTTTATTTTNAGTAASPGTQAEHQRTGVSGSDSLRNRRFRPCHDVVRTILASSGAAL
jgi:hypothetical protein